MFCIVALRLAIAEDDSVLRSVSEIIDLHGVHWSALNNLPLAVGKGQAAADTTYSNQLLRFVYLVVRL